MSVLPQLTVNLCMIQAKEYHHCLLRLLSAEWLPQRESSQVSSPPEVVIGYHCGYCPARIQGGWGPLLLGLTLLPAWTRSWMPDAALPLCIIVTTRHHCHHPHLTEMIRLAEIAHGQSQHCNVLRSQHSKVMLKCRPVKCSSAGSIEVMFVKIAQHATKRHCGMTAHRGASAVQLDVANRQVDMAALRKM